jgi:hypothetical protein
MIEGVTLGCFVEGELVAAVGVGNCGACRPLAS